MTDLDWKRAEAPAEALQALASHRLLPVVELLAERGLIREQVRALAAPLARKKALEVQRKADFEAEVLEALSAAGLDVLVLKGALLARTVYPDPSQRIRSDLDLLVDIDSFTQAVETLGELGFRPMYPVHSGLPITQESLVRRAGSGIQGVDLHWHITHRSVLKNRIHFGHLWQRRAEIATLPRGIFGLSHPDALLHACAHYFAHFGGDFRPDQWILDFDLLWRAMDEETRAECECLARERGIGSLLAAGLGYAQTRFETPVDLEKLQRMAEEGASERPARLLQSPRFGLREIVRNALDEPDRREGAQLMFRTFFPRAAYMRYKYPGSARWALPWLYVKRMLGAGKG